MGRSRLRHLLVLVGIAISTLFLYVAVRNVDFAAFRDALAGGNYVLLGPAVAVLGIAIYLRALRWRVLFTPPHRPPLGAVTGSLLIGYLFNSVLPARAGEAARIVALHQRARTSRFEALSTVVAERVLDVLVLLGLLVATAPFIPESTWMRKSAAIGGGAFVLLTLVLVLFAFFGERPARRLLRPLTLIPGVSRADTERAAGNLVRGLGAFRRPGMALRAVVLTAISWLVIALAFWMCLAAIRVDAGFSAALVVVIAVNLAMVLPSAPAGLGVFHAATVVTLSAFGVERSQALSYAVVAHAVSYLPLILVGYLALHQHALAVRRTSASSFEDDAAVTHEHARASGLREAERALARGELPAAELSSGPAPLSGSRSAARRGWCASPVSRRAWTASLFPKRPNRPL